MSFILNLIILAQQFQDLIEIRDNLKAQTENLKSQIDVSKDEMNGLKKRLDEFVKRVVELEKKIDDLKPQIDELQQELNGPDNQKRQTAWRYKRQISGLNGLMETYTTQLSNSRDLLNATLILYEDTKNRVDGLNNQLETTNRQIGTLDELINSAKKQSN